MRFLSAGDIALRKRRPDSHKGENGRVLVVGGSDKYTGAVLLAGMSAFRAGADMVVLAAPEKAAAAARLWPDFIVAGFKGRNFSASHADEILRIAKDFDVLLIGNGLGLEKQTMRFARKAVKASCAKVIDADAIKAVRLQDVKNSILTPHKKELEILLGNSGVPAVFAGSPERLRPLLGDNVLLVKGRIDFIISRDRIAFNRTGNPGMTKAGTGDVLAGLCAGIAAQGNSLFDAACAAAYVNGLAGDLLLKDYGYGFTATELADRAGLELMRWLA